MVDSLFHPRDIVSVYSTFGKAVDGGQFATDGEEVVLYTEYCLLVFCLCQICEQQSDETIQFIHRTVCFQSGM